MDNHNKQNNNNPYQSGSGTDYSDPNHDNLFTPSPSSLEDPSMGRLKHSGPGIASFVIGLVSIIGYMLIFFCHNGYKQFNWRCNHTDPSGGDCITSSSCSGFSGCSSLSDS